VPPYLVVDVELSRPLPAVALGAREDGVALLVRRRGRPLGLVLRALAPGTALDAEQLGEMIAAELRVALVRAAVEDELAPAPEAEPLPLAVVDGPVTDAALRTATTSHVAFLASGTVADEGWQAGAAEAIAEQPDAAAVTGPVLPRALPTEAAVAFERNGGRHLGFEKLRFVGEWRPGEPSHPIDPRGLGTQGNLLVRRDAALAVGGAGEGEADLLYRLLRAGHALAYEPRMLAFHDGPADPQAAAARFAGHALRVARTDASQRDRARRALAWWAMQAAKRLLSGPIPADPRTRPQALAELAGAARAARSPR
jgi:hypothetical protein